MCPRPSPRWPRLDQLNAYHFLLPDTTREPPALSLLCGSSPPHVETTGLSDIGPRTITSGWTDEWGPVKTVYVLTGRGVRAASSRLGWAYYSVSVSRQGSALTSSPGEGGTLVLSAWVRLP